MCYVIAMALARARLTPRGGGVLLKDPLWDRAVRGSQSQATAEVF